jgi:prophage DNA circulation protein
MPYFSGRIWAFLPIIKQTNMSAELSEKVSHIEDLLKDLANQVSDVQGKMDNMQENVRKMYTSIVGDEAFGHKGLVTRMDELEDTKKRWEKKAGWVYGYIIGAGTILTIFFELIKSAK